MKMKKKVLIIWVALMSLGFNGTCFGQTKITSTEDAKQVFQLIFDATNSEISMLGEITSTDKEMATMLLDELVKCSNRTKIASNFINNTGVKSVYIAIGKSIVDSIKGVTEGRYNPACKNTLKRNWKTSWESRKQLGEW